MIGLVEHVCLSLWNSLPYLSVVNRDYCLHGSLHRVVDTCSDYRFDIAQLQFVLNVKLHAKFCAQHFVVISMCLL
jgi:hypothetical protein